MTLDKNKDKAVVLAEVKQILKPKTTTVLVLYTCFEFFYFVVHVVDVQFKLKLFLSVQFTLFMEALLLLLIVVTLLKRKQTDKEAVFVFIYWSIFLMVLHFYPVVAKLPYKNVYPKDVPLNHYLPLWFIAPYITKKWGCNLLGFTAKWAGVVIYFWFGFICSYLLYVQISPALFILFIPLFCIGLDSIVRQKPQDKNLAEYAENLVGRKKLFKK